MPSPTSQAFQLTQKLEYERSEQILSKSGIRHSDAPSAYLYIRLINSYALRKKNECLKYSGAVLDLFNCPERYRVIAFIIRDDVSQWQTGDMGDISREMKQVTERISTRKAGASTQRLQKEIVDKLDKLIKQKEQDKADASGKGDGQGQDKGKDAEGPASDPQKDSNGGQDGGKGAVDPRKFADLNKKWGALPPKERAAAIQDLVKGLPSQYQELIERYFKQLTKSKDGD